VGFYVLMVGFAVAAWLLVRELIRLLGPKVRGGRRRARLEREAAQRLTAFRTAPGGSPEHPIPVTAPSVVEVKARATPCPLCASQLRVREHAAETLGGERLRVAHVACVRCEFQGTLYFTLEHAEPN
jgi:hypothetical protein